MDTPFYTLSVADTVARLETDPTSGLTSAEAHARLAQYGPNELEHAQKTPLWRSFLEQFTDFMIWVLLGAVGISLFEGQYVEGGAIVAILLINAVLGVFQEYRAGQALEALKEMSAPSALAVRDGELVTLDARELVPGDIVSIETGNKIPADGRLIETAALRCEEAALTGESKPARKDAEALPALDSPLGDRTDMVFAGTSVSVGRGLYAVTETGTHTEMGTIARLMEEAEEGSTPLQIELNRVGKRIALLVLAVCAIVFIVDMVQGIDFSESLLVAISLAVAAIPEGLPAIVTIALALGVKRMAEQHAIVKKLPAVETLGSTSFICSDKTGTLTQNVMTVRDALVGLTPVVIRPDEGLTFQQGPANPDDEALLFDIALSTNDARYNAEHVLIGDPTETALVVAAHARHADAIARVRIGEIPFSSDRKRMATIHEDEHGKREVYVKGGVDVILSLCDRARINGEIVELTPALIDTIMAFNEGFAAQGNRTLAFAYRPFASDEELEGDHIERGLIFVGIMAMLDPPRPEVVASVREAYEAGIDIAMITGDHALTARAIATEIGLPTDTPVITGPELENMTDEELFEIVNDTHIYARVNPEHKIRIVSALKRHGHIVAMTGDGVNDAPALKAADIGVAMGLVGTDVSREAADMVLSDDNFATIVKAVEQGRIVFDNLRKSILFLLSCNMSEVLIVFLTALFPLARLFPESDAAGLVGPALLPVQLLLINLVTDSMPALALGVDPGSKRVMQRKPRNPDESILSARSLSRIVVQGALITLGALTAYYGSAWGWFGETDPHHTQTMLLTAIVLMQLMHAFTFRSSTRSIFSAETFKNKWLNAAFVGSLLVHIGIIYLPFMQRIFRTAPLDFVDWFQVLLAVLVPLVLIDIHKLLTREKKEGKNKHER